MGHRDLATTQIYADYAPNAREAEMVAAAFSRSNAQLGPQSAEEPVPGPSKGA